MKVEEIVGQNLRRAREQERWSQATLGEELEQVQGKGRGWSRQAVHAAERGQRAFAVSDLLVLSLVLGRPVSWFIKPPTQRTRVELRQGVSIPAHHVMGLFEAQPMGALDDVIEETTHLQDELAELEEDLGHAHERIRYINRVADGVRVLSGKRLDAQNRIVSGHAKAAKKRRKK